MKGHVFSLVLLALSCGFAYGQQAGAVPPAGTPPVAHEDHKHMSKKEKKELKKERDQERKDEKHRQKKEAEERKKEDKQREKDIAKERKRDHDKENKKIAKERHDERKHEQKEESRVEHAGQPSMAGRAAGMAGSAVTAPFRIARYATPRLLNAQRNVSRAIYSQLPTSNVAVLLSDAGQIVLRGAAPTPSVRSRLLQLAMGAAGGYPIIDELAANFVGDAASAATSAAISGIGDLIHRQPDNNAPDSSVADSSAPPDASANALPPDTGASAGIAALDPGSRACVNVSSGQVLLTGQAGSQASAALIRQFARQLGGANAVLNDQLATRTNGTVSAAPAQVPPTTSSADAAPNGTAMTATPIAPGSNVCVNVTSGSELMLTGTVSSPSELSAVEEAAQPLVASARLTDQLTIGSASTTTAGTAIGSSTDSTAPPTGVTAEESTLEQALHAIPRLANVDAAVAADTVRLTGAVDTSQDEQMARDIARQHAPGLSIVDNLAVAGRPPQPGTVPR